MSRSPISVHITRLNVRPTGSRAQHARSVRIVGLRQEPCDGSWKLSSSFPTSRRWVRPRARRPASGCHHRLDQALEAKRDLDLDDQALGELVPPGSSRTPTATRSQRLIPAQRIDPDIRLTMALRQPRSPRLRAGSTVGTLLAVGCRGFRTTGRESHGEGSRDGRRL